MFVTHDQEEALSMATRIAVMAGGRVDKSGRLGRSTSGRSIDWWPTSSANRTSSMENGPIGGSGGRFRLRRQYGDPGTVDRRRGAQGPHRLDDPARVHRRRSPGTERIRPSSCSVAAPSTWPSWATTPGITVQTDAGLLVAIRFHETDERAIDEGLVDREVHVWWSRESTVVAAGDELEPSEETGGGSGE